jgi:GNAT superfamily N-acetyltransferase
VNSYVIKKAEKKDRDFILFANQKVNIASGIKESFLAENIERDVLCDDPKCECLVVQKENEPVGMCLYSKIYWADFGQGIYLSQVYVRPEHRKNGIFKMLVNYMFENGEDIKFVTCMVGDENAAMQKVMTKTGWKTFDLKYYYLMNKC